jgi:aminotransferase
MDREDIEAIAEVLRDTNIAVISDEIYAELTFGKTHVSVPSVEGMRERTILVNGFSKAFAMTGWRLGYLCAPKEICDAALKIHQYAMMSAPTASQFAAIEALKSGEEAKDEMVAEYRIRRNLFVKGLNDIGLSCHLPQGAFYAFPSIESTGLSDEEFAERLLKEQQVAVVPGSAFGESGKGHVRTCYAVDRPRLTEAVRRIGEFVDSL